jgi:Domain of unknown function (DUF4262)
MCWQCDHPQATYADYLDHMRDLIARYGWAVQGVNRDRLHPPWAYTVGLTPRGLPELVVTGMQVTHATCLLNEIASHALHAEFPQPGEQIPLVGGPLIEIVKVVEPSAHLNLAVSLYGPQIRALQIVHADDRDHWPWDSYYRGIRGGQPVLGVRSVGSAALPPTSSG